MLILKVDMDGLGGWIVMRSVVSDGRMILVAHIGRIWEVRLLYSLVMRRRAIFFCWWFKF